MSFTETYGMRCSGGPLDGRTLLVKPGMELHGWPLPGDFAYAGGRYEKVRESQLPEAVPGVLRGAEYEWRPEEVAPTSALITSEVAPSDVGGASE